MRASAGRLAGNSSDTAVAPSLHRPSASRVSSGADRSFSHSGHAAGGTGVNDSISRSGRCAAARSASFERASAPPGSTIAQQPPGRDPVTRPVRGRQRRRRLLGGRAQLGRQQPRARRHRERVIGIETERFEIVVDRDAAVARGLLEPRPPVRGLDRGTAGGELGLVQPVTGAVETAAHQVRGRQVERRPRRLVAPLGPGRQQLQDLERRPFASGAPLDAHRRDQSGGGELSGGLGEVRPPIARARRPPLALQLVAAALLEQRAGAIVGAARPLGEVAEAGGGVLEVAGPEPRAHQQIERVDVAAAVEIARQVLGGDLEVARRVLELAVMMEARAQDSRRVGVELELRQPQQAPRREARREIGAVLAQQIEQRVGALDVAAGGAVELVEDQPPPRRGRQLLEREVLEHAAVAALLEGADQQPLALFEQGRRGIVLQQRDQQPRRKLGVAELGLDVGDAEQRVRPQPGVGAHHAGIDADGFARSTAVLEQVAHQVLDAQRPRRLGLLAEHPLGELQRFDRSVLLRERHQLDARIDGDGGEEAEAREHSAAGDPLHLAAEAAELALHRLVAAIEVVDAFDHRLPLRHQAGDHQARRRAQVGRHHPGAGERRGSGHPRQIAFDADRGSHARQLGHVLEAVLEHRLADRGVAARLGHQRHVLRLQVGGEAGVRRGHYVARQQVAVARDADPVRARLDLGAARGQLLQQRSQVRRRAGCRR